MAHPNEELVRRSYDAFARGDMDTLRELFDPEIVWHFPGRSLLAGDHRGTDAVLGFFGRTMELTAGTFRAELHDVVADDWHAVGMHLATGEREGGGFRTERSWGYTPRRQGRRGMAVHRGPVRL
jgi:ketosteroid isomerase-like protein